MMSLNDLVRDVQLSVSNWNDIRMLAVEHPWKYRFDRRNVRVEKLYAFS